MSGSGGQPQFRYTQPPSKVLHVRNLPWECTEEELIELCKPFGKVVNTKLNVGANHNQAFVEFADLNQAISMVSYYASSSEPAQVRGKAVYLQYSTRQEIVTTKQSGDVASNVLLVTIEGVEAGDVSIDVLHLVFSAFGFVHKIATFEKSAGFQALVQFGDPNTASAAKSALEGRSIPRYLLPEHVTSCSLRISFSAHNDLNVKFQSHRSRDYTNPYLPVAPSATDTSGQLFGLGPDGKKREPESNVLLVSIENMQYAVTIEVLHTVFSAFGTVQKIAIFEKTAGFQALVQYPDIPTAVQAKEALEGHCVYDGGYCKLRLSYSRHTDLNVKANNERSRDYTNPGLPPQAAISSPGTPGSQPGMGRPQQGYGPQFGGIPGPPPADGQAQMGLWDYDLSKAPGVPGGMPPGLPGPPGAPYNAAPSGYGMPSGPPHGANAGGGSGQGGPPGGPPISPGGQGGSSGSGNASNSRGPMGPHGPLGGPPGVPMQQNHMHMGPRGPGHVGPSGPPGGPGGPPPMGSGQHMSAGGPGPGGAPGPSPGRGGPSGPSGPPSGPPGVPPPGTHHHGTPPPNGQFGPGPANMRPGGQGGPGGPGGGQGSAGFGSYR